MRELLVQQKAFAVALFCLKPASEPLQGDSMQNMVSRSFLLSLWWKELTCLAALLCVLLFVATRLALRNRAPQRPEKDPVPIDLAERLKQLSGEL